MRAGSKPLSAGQYRSDPNLLSATFYPLEMGNQHWDLSTGPAPPSVRPEPANYPAADGRAGRRDWAKCLVTHHRQRHPPRTSLTSSRAGGDVCSRGRRQPPSGLLSRSMLAAIAAAQLLASPWIVVQAAIDAHRALAPRQLKPPRAVEKAGNAGLSRHIPYTWLQWLPKPHQASCWERFFGSLPALLTHQQEAAFCIISSAQGEAAVERSLYAAS